MRLVVYETMFGTTRDVALAVASALGPAEEVRAVEVTALVEGRAGGGVAAAPGALPDETTLLVVGGPTHAFGMTRATTRRDAARYGDVVSRTGVREWLAGLTLPRGLPVAAFGTKLASPLSGSSARAIAVRLRRLGGSLVVPPRDFFVRGSVPEIVGGQLDAARDWGTALAGRLASR